MRLRENIDDERTSPEEGGAGDGEGGENLARVRQAGHGLLAAGADAIQKALSGDSESFLAATRQQGGQ